MKAGEIDIECGGNTNTAARQRDVDFFQTFFITGLRLLARKSLTVQSSGDLWHKRVAVSRGTTAEALFNQLKIEQGIEVVPVSDDPEGVRFVEEAKADAFAQDDVLLYGLLAGSAMKNQLALTGKFMTMEPYAFMLPKGDIAFARVVDRTLLG